MKNYILYMKNQQVSPNLHQKLLEIPHRSTAPAGTLPWRKLLLSAACLVLITAAAARLPAAPPVTLSASQQQGAALQPVPPESSIENAGCPKVPDDDPPADSSGSANLPMLPAVRYPDVTGKSDVARDIAWPDGSFTVGLTEEQIALILWGTPERYDAADGKIPSPLFWEGYSLSAQAVYDGKGDLWQVSIFGDAGGTDSFTLLLAPEHLPPTCIVHAYAAVTEVRGVEVSGWMTHYDRNGDGVEEYVYETSLLSHGVGLRFQSVSHNENALPPSLVNWATYADGGLSLDHLLTSESIPDWRKTEFTTLSEARQEEPFAPYLPENYPFPYGEFYSYLNYQERSCNMLHIRWSLGYDDVEIDIHLPESGEAPSIPLADPDNPASYDVRLYEIPWADTVPQEYQADFYKPVFRAEEMSLAIIEARMTEKDTGGFSCRFCVLHENGVLVSYSCSGLTATEIWSLVEPTL